MNQDSRERESERTQNEIICKVGQSRLTVVHMENNTIINQ